MRLKLLTAVLNLFEDWISKNKGKETKELELANECRAAIVPFFPPMQTEHVAEFVEPEVLLPCFKPPREITRAPTLDIFRILYIRYIFFKISKIVFEG